MESDNDNDHSCSQLSVQNAHTCPEGQSARTLALPFSAKGSLRAETMPRATWIEMGLCLLQNMRSVAGPLCAVLLVSRLWFAPVFVSNLRDASAERF